MKNQYGNFVAECQGFSDSPHELGEDTSSKSPLSRQELLEKATGLGLPEADDEHCNQAMMDHYAAEVQQMVYDKEIFKGEAHQRMGLFSQLCTLNAKAKEQAAKEEEADAAAMKLLQKDRSLGEDA